MKHTIPTEYIAFVANNYKDCENDSGYSESEKANDSYARFRKGYRIWFLHGRHICGDNYYKLIELTFDFKSKTYGEQINYYLPRF